MMSVAGYHPTKADAEAAITRAIRQGRCHHGYAVVTFQGPGGTTAYQAHVSKGATSWVLR